jgi:hypothetical protein
MVTWQFYLGRRRVTNTRLWAASRGISTYDELCRSLDAVGTTIPGIEEAYSFFISRPEIVVQTPVVIEQDVVPAEIEVSEKDEKPVKEEKSGHDKKSSEKVKKEKSDR